MDHRGRIALLGALVLALGNGGCGLSPSIEAGYLKQIKITNHELVATHYNTGIFLGPPTTDLLSAASAPAMRTAPSSIPLSSAEWEFIGFGDGTADDGTACTIHFKRLREGHDPAFPDWDPDDAQRRSWTRAS